MNWCKALISIVSKIRFSSLAFSFNFKYIYIYIFAEARIRYDTGDHLGVYPTNDSALVEAIIQLLDFNPDNVCA